METRNGALKGRHIVFVAGEDEYFSERTLASLAVETAAAYGAATTLLRPADPANPTDIPGLEALQTADLAVFYLRFRQLPQEQLDAILNYVRQGKPVIGFRTSTHAFRYGSGDPLEEWNDRFGIEVLGAPWIRHFGHSSSTDVSIAWGAAGHPILEQVPERFDMRSWLYCVLPYPPEGAQLLLNGTAVNPELREGDPDEDRLPRTHPVAWIRRNDFGGETFMTTMGHPEDFEREAFRRLIFNAMGFLLNE